MIPRVEVVAVGDVVFFTDAFETIQTTGPFLHQPDAQPQQIARPASRPSDPMRLGDQTGAQQLGEQVRVQPIRFDLGGSDGLKPGGVGQDELHTEVINRMQRAGAWGRIDLCGYGLMFEARNRVGGPRGVTCRGC